MRIWILLLLTCCTTLGGTTSVWGFAERPRSYKGTTPPPATPAIPATPAAPAPVQAPNAAAPVAPELPVSPALSIATANLLGDEELADTQKAYKDQIETRQFAEALATLERIPQPQWNDKQRAHYPVLLIFKQAEEEGSKTSSLFQKDSDIDEPLRKTTNKLYKESQMALLNGKPELSRDLLIQILFLNRRDSKSRKLLEYGLHLKVGEYRVEDVEDKYWNKSSVLFYGGNYGEAVEALSVLVFFDKENPLIYERMGSSYYMLGEKRKAIEAWGTALFFNPKNTELKDVVDRAKKAMADEEVEARERTKTKKTTTTTAPAIADADLQLMGLFKTQGEAYNFAAELKKRGLDTYVDEQDNGKWSVKVPKVQMQKK